MKLLLEGVLLLFQESNQMEHYLGLVYQKLRPLFEFVSQFSHSKRRRVQGETFKHLRIPLPAITHPRVCEPPLTALGRTDYQLPEHRVFQQLLGHSQLPQELFPNPHGVLTFKRKTQTKSVECWLTNQSVGWFKPDVDSVLNLQAPLQKILMRCFCQFVAHPAALQIIKQLRFTFMPQSKHEFVPHDQVFPSVVIYCSLLLLNNKQFHASFIQKNHSGQLSPAYFLF